MRAKRAILLPRKKREAFARLTRIPRLGKKRLARDDNSNNQLHPLVLPQLMQR